MTVYLAPIDNDDHSPCLEIVLALGKPHFFSYLLGHSPNLQGRGVLGSQK